MGIPYVIFSKIPHTSEALSINQKLKNEILKKYLSQYLRLSTLLPLKLHNQLSIKYLKIHSVDDEKINIYFLVR